MALMTAAVRARPEPLVLYYSPGGGNSPADSMAVAAGQTATFYRTLTDFHGGWADWGGLQQAIFIAGNFTAAGLHGANGTWPVRRRRRRRAWSPPPQPPAHHLPLLAHPLAHAPRRTST